MARGGNRTPANPAPVSGPGALSQRTDGGPGQTAMQMPDAAYGEQADFQDIQNGAPMMADPMAMGMDPMAAGPSAPPPMPLNAPTARPGEPITEGIPMGAGANDLQGVQDVMSEDMQMLTKYLPAMRHMAEQEGVPRSFQLFTKYLESYQA